MSGQNPVEQLCMEQLEQQYGGVVARALLCKEAAGSSWVRGHLRSGKSVKGYQRGEHPEQEPINVKHKTTSVLPEIKPGQSRVFELCVQDHRARKAGRHFDLRLGDPRTQIGYSWAIPKARLPEPGEKLLAVRQPDHQLAYFDFRGILSDGYGAGTVDLHLRGRSTITESSPSLVRFSVTEKQQTSDYVLRRTGNTAWLLQNVTAVKQARTYIIDRRDDGRRPAAPGAHAQQASGNLLLGLLDLMRFRPLTIKNMGKDRREDVQQIIADQRKRLSGFTEEQRRQIMLWQLAQTSPEVRAVLGLSTVPADERKKKLASAVSLRDALLQEPAPTAPLGQLPATGPAKEQMTPMQRLQLLREVSRQRRARRQPPELDAAGRKAAAGDDSDPDNPQDALLPPTQGSPAAIAATRGEGIKEQGE